MRPGPRGPGNIRVAPAPRLSLERFNEAGAARPRKFGDECDIVIAENASMRPGPRGPGNSQRLEVLLEILVASMRPGPRGPGNLGPEGKRIVGAFASMRPGPRGPGNTDAGVKHLHAHVRFNEAGAARPRKSPTNTTIPTQSKTRFNEAGAARPRKWLPVPPAPPHSRLLQ